MLEYNELWKGNYMSVISPKLHPYECVHEKNVILVLPIVAIKSKYMKGAFEYFFVVRKEHCPPYLVKDQIGNDFYYTIVSGGIEKGETPEEAMKRELLEETGITPIDYQVLFEKKDIPVCKTSDMRSNVFGLLINSFTSSTPTGDGTLNEKLSTSVLVNINNMYKILNKPNVDFLLYSGYFLVMNSLKDFIKI